MKHERRKPGIFIGLTEIGNIVASYTLGFQELGHHTWSVIEDKNPYFLNETYDIVLNRNIYSYGRSNLRARLKFSFSRRWMLARLFIKAIFTCDIFIFLFGSSFLPLYADYLLLRILRKKIVSVFCGCDIRHWHPCEQELEMLGISGSFKSFCNGCESRGSCSLSIKIYKARAAERYSTLILAQRNLAQLLTRPYMRINLPLRLSDYDFNIPGRGIPLVVHAPSNRSIKGTAFILKTVDRLKNDGFQFIFRLIENTSNSECRKILADADIVVDALYGQTVGFLALESMATGNAVLSSTRYDYEMVPGSCPVVSINEGNIYDELKRTISDKEYRIALAQAGRHYVKQYHDHVIIAREILGWLQQGKIQQYDYYPDFARQHYRLPHDIITQEKKTLAFKFRRGT